MPLHADSAETLPCLVNTIELKPYARHQPGGAYGRVQPFRDSKGLSALGRHPSPGTKRQTRGAHCTPQQSPGHKGLRGFSRRTTVPQPLGLQVVDMGGRAPGLKKELSQVWKMNSRTNDAKGEALSPPRGISALSPFFIKPWITAGTSWWTQPEIRFFWSFYKNPLK